MTYAQTLPIEEKRELLKIILKAYEECQIEEGWTASKTFSKINEVCEYFGVKPSHIFMLAAL